MCLYPKLVLNPKYLSNKKNKGNPPKMVDSRVKYVPVGCGNCIECRKQKSNEWKIRLREELKTQKEAMFVTLTFQSDELKKICDEKQLSECNAIAGIAVRRFLERYRKKYKKSVKHWLITELGHENTERIHLHGIIFKKIEKEELNKLWSYGMADNGKYCTEKTINYIVKYVTKIDEKHKDFKPQIFCSAGLGKEYLTSTNATLNKFNPNGETFEAYQLPDGSKRGLPIYYRNKLYSDSEREQLWLKRLDKKERYVLGQQIDISTARGEASYWRVLSSAQLYNTRMGYGDDSKMWKKKEYNVTLKMLNKNLHNQKKVVPLPNKPKKQKS